MKTLQQLLEEQPQVKSLDVRKLEFLNEKYGLTYDEAMNLATYAKEQISEMSPFDIAYQRFVADFLQMSKYACLINDVHKLGRTDHLHFVKVLVLFKDEMCETKLGIPKHELTAGTDIFSKIEDVIRNRLNQQFPQTMLGPRLEFTFEILES